MKIDEIKLMYEYNFWADRRILEACANLSAEQFTEHTPSGSLRSTLIHTVDSQWSWRIIFQTHFTPLDKLADAPEAQMWSADNELTEADLPTLEALKDRWQIEEQEMHDYLASLSDSDLNGLVRYGIPGGIVRERVLWHCLMHVVNHGTQHRSEAAAMLTSFGHSPGGMDFTLFLNEHFNLQNP